jgi:internalin A
VVPESVGNLTALTTLDLSGNQLTAVPEPVGNLTALTWLDLSGNQLTAVPESVGNLTALTWLDLSGNQLIAVPESVGNLTALARLGLGGNQLTAVPDWVGNPGTLSVLDLSGNQLTAVPESVGNLTALTTLDLGGNQLTAVPDWVGNLAALTWLDLSGNQLTAVPESVGNLTALTTLDLSGNQVACVPRELADLLDRGLRIDLDDNPLADLLPELARRGARALAVYLRSLDDEVELFEGKLLLVGEGEVGKTSLVAALKDPAAPLVVRPRTHGIEITPLTFRHPGLGLDMTLRAWDFGGQEAYRVTHQFFFSRRALYVLVWKPRRGQEQDEVQGWLRRIRLRAGGDARVLVVATHCADLHPELDYAQLRLDFPGILTGSFEVDNDTKEGLEVLSEAIGRQAAKLPQMGQRVSARWAAARDDILAWAATEPQIWFEQFAEICGQHGLTGREIVTLAQLMHDLGHIIYYGDDDGLRDIVVLNPEWLTQAISCVLDDKATRQAGGLLDHASLRHIWQDSGKGYPTRYYPYFLRLMEKFDISYRLGDEPASLVAQLVPYERPSGLPWQPSAPAPAGIRVLSMECRLSEPAPGLIPWLTVRHHRASTGLYWRRGIFLRHPIAAYQSEALLELRGDGELAFEVRAPSPDLFFHELRGSIEELITRRWPGLRYELLIPCPVKTADGSRCAGRFALADLLALREGSQFNTIPCLKCRQALSLSELLTGFAAPDQFRGQLNRIEGAVDRLEKDAAQKAYTIRRILRAASAEISDCPRLFTIVPDHPSAARRARVYQRHYRLTLWCEHSGSWHAWPGASYHLDVQKDWFARIAPYAALVVRTLQLAVPLAGNLAAMAPPPDQLAHVQVDLQLMGTLVADLPGKPGQDLASSAMDQASSDLTPAEGEALRALRVILFQFDKLQAFGGLRRVQAPSGDFLWVCAEHYRDYDPGLPALP